MKRTGTYQRLEERAAIGFIAPAILSLLIFTFYPMLKAFLTSFEDYNLISARSNFVGLSNYLNLLQDSSFLDSLLHSLHFAVIVIPVQTAIALGMAMLVFRSSWVSGLFRTLYFLPVVISMGVASTLFKLVYNKDFGLLNSLLKTLGLPPVAFLSDSHLAMYGIMLLGMWKAAGFFMIVFIAGLNNIPQSLYEAAEVDGATAWQKFYKITLPLLRRTMTFVVVITTMDAIKISGPVFILTGGGPADSTTTAVYYIYKTAFQQMDMGYASAAAFILFVIVPIISLVQLRLFKTDVEY